MILNDAGQLEYTAAELLERKARELGEAAEELKAARMREENAESEVISARQHTLNCEGRFAEAIATLAAQQQDPDGVTAEANAEVRRILDRTSERRADH
jgi:uncharacterized protein (DUF3084 family)